MEQADDYPRTCPYCYGRSLTVGEQYHDPDDQTANRDVRCNKCGREWTATEAAPCV